MMEKRKMGKCNVEVSPLGYGMMRPPMLDGTVGNFDKDGKKIDIEQTISLVRYAIDHGVNYVDTAYNYMGGHSERVTGLALQDGYREKVFLATKSPTYLYQSEDDFDRFLNTQLERLQTDHIDFYLLHTLGRENWDKVLKFGALDRLRQAKKDGKVRFIGFSFHDEFPVFKEIVDYLGDEWDFCQIQLNYMDANEREAFQQAGMKGYRLTEELGIPLVIMEPIKGGSLAAFPEDITEMYRKLDKDASVASFALRWVGSLPNVKVILSGMSTMEQVEDNLKTFREFKPLSEEEKQTIDKVVEIINSRIQNGCTGCRYCMPCPAGVDIPQNFRIWNLYHMYRNYNMVKNNWEKNLAEENKAKNCIKCGKCERACPQKLSIREDLVKVQEDLDKKEFVL